MRKQFTGSYLLGEPEEQVVCPECELALMQSCHFCGSKTLEPIAWKENQNPSDVRIYCPSCFKEQNEEWKQYRFRWDNDARVYVVKE
ncbi:MAG: hypothetical protein QW104_07210 [Nitrososphaerota archaeon]